MAEEIQHISKPLSKIVGYVSDPGSSNDQSIRKTRVTVRIRVSILVRVRIKVMVGIKVRVSNRVRVANKQLSNVQTTVL